jgi:chemotaxis protein MotB
MKLRFPTRAGAALLVPALLANLLVGCGYSEEEWQRQLDKYSQLENQHEQERAAHAATRAELDAAKQRVDSLANKLSEMGFNMDALNAQLQQTGTEKEQLAASLTELQQALEEYKRRAEQLERIKARFETLRTRLQKLVNMGLKVEIRRTRMVIRLPGDVLFASGQDKLRDEGKEVIAAVAEVIRTDKALQNRYFQVAGHTDNVPLKGGRFGDNWGLSAMRARQVLLYFIAPVDEKDGGGGLNPNQLHAAGYGETDPVGENESDEGRQANRRVELVIMPDVEEMLDLKELI